MSGQETIPLRMSEHVERHPEKPFLKFFDAKDLAAAPRMISYGALWATAAHAIDSLDKLVVGDVLLLVMPLSPDLFAAHLAGMLKGCVVSIYTPPSAKMAEHVYHKNLSHALTLVRPAAVITTSSLSDKIAPLAAAASSECIVVDLDWARPPAVPMTLPNLSSDASLPVILQHSSGSTGMQKGVQLNHHKVITQCQSYGEFIDYDGNSDAICSWLPMYHDMGLFTAWMMPLVLGGTVNLLDPFSWVQNPASIVNLANQVRGTLIWQPNFAFNLLADRVSDEHAQSLDLSCMRGFTNCSEPVHQKVMARFQAHFAKAGVAWEQLWSCYAMAENAFAVTATKPGDARDGALEIDAESFAANLVEPVRPGRASKTIASCGHAVDGCQVRIVDAERNQIGDRRVGEIAILSTFLFDAYVENPEATRDAIDEAGWYYTGDLGFSIAGQLYVTGRKKDLIIVGGRNFYPQDIESICNDIDGVVSGRCVALGLNNEVLGTEGVLVIVEAREGDLERADDIAAQIRRVVFENLDCAVNEVHVSPHMWLLKTSSGKIARQSNLDRFLAVRKTTDEQCTARDLNGSNPAVSTPLSALLWGGLFGGVFCLYLLFSLWNTSESWVIYAGF